MLGAHKTSFVIRQGGLLLADTCTGADPQIAERSVCASIKACLDRLEAEAVTC